MKINEFVDLGYQYQDILAKKIGKGEKSPLDALTYKEREEFIIYFLGHLVEEAHEARAWIPRKRWKRNEKSIFEQTKYYNMFIEECADILIFLRAVLVYAGIEGDDFEAILSEKLAKNEVRPDHKFN